AHYGGSRVDIFDPTGKHVDAIPVPGAKVTNVAFGGADNQTIVITDVETASLYRARLDVAGQPLYDGRSISLADDLGRRQSGRTTDLL
ncbi:MAG: SMP-30/gluconolactonase/LRE family protein, partial [Thermomicrobiales bacterium]